MQTALITYKWFDHYHDKGMFEICEKNKYTLRQNLYNNTKNLNIELKIELP